MVTAAEEVAIPGEIYASGDGRRASRSPGSVSTIRHQTPVPVAIRDT